MLFISEEDQYRNITFDQLREIYPKTSFCVPVKQTALPEGVILAELFVDLNGDPFPKEKNKKTVPSQPFKLNDKWFFQWEQIDVSEEELEAQIDLVDSKVTELINSISWMIAEDSSERLNNKYKKLRKEIFAVFEQDGYPFHVAYPEL